MNKTQLTIHISRTSVHVAEVLRSNQNIVRESSLVLYEQSPSEYKNKLKSFFDGLNWADKYDEYSMAWGSPKHTLLPLSAFNESSAKAVYALMFGEDVDENTIDFNRLMELNFVSVFEIPDWVKSFFIMRFPQIVFKHEHAMTLRALFQKNTFKRKIVVSFSDDYINIAVIHQNELIFSNCFEVQTAEDVLYYLLFVIEQKQLKQEEGTISFLYIDETTKEKAEQTKQLLADLKGHSKLKVTDVDHKLKLQTLCV
ncbi:DUF3822 family protein [Brumimicrobium salinarum]|uniref:DUF3822 family protein n=1 Tax=Brumimicrobium salinarum TaxID=2058658 RepID=UPI0013FD76B9|nr:DUF3822 family protein [Brumimicrobium salinarum]